MIYLIHCVLQSNQNNRSLIWVSSWTKSKNAAAARLILSVSTSVRWRTRRSNWWFRLAKIPMRRPLCIGFFCIWACSRYGEMMRGKRENFFSREKKFSLSPRAPLSLSRKAKKLFYKICFVNIRKTLVSIGGCIREARSRFALSTARECTSVHDRRGADARREIDRGAPPPFRLSHNIWDINFYLLLPAFVGNKAIFLKKVQIFMEKIP